MNKRWRGLIPAVLLLFAAAQPAPAQEDNVAGPFVPTPWVIVDEMLKLADVAGGDMLYDLGSGDGRLVIAAARRHGARGVGVELQPQLVEIARQQAAKDGVERRVKFVQADLFEYDLSAASVVTLYLLPRFVTRLVPKLRAELAPGARVVSHDYALSPWPPDKTLIFNVEEKEAISGTQRTVLYYYVVPARVGGAWSVRLPASLSATSVTLRIRQEPDQLSGVAEIDGDSIDMREFSVKADAIRFGLFRRGRMMQFTGKVRGREMSGETNSRGLVGEWSARSLAPR